MSEEIRLSVIFVQYDRKKYALALERLVSLLADFESLDFIVAVVDNANPGFWQHRVSEHIVQVGGDNSAWEFSAFDRGIEFLAEEGREADIYAFVTDAFLAYGEDYLELIDEATLKYCLGLDSCVGWVDSFMGDLEACGYSYRDWMRTSFFFLPAGLLNAAMPMTTPLDPSIIFGPSAASPFLESAPLSGNLQENLLAWLTREKTDVALEEVWHSQLELADSSFDFFKAKVLAILREHLFSARFQSLEVPCYDFRLIRRLSEANVDLSGISSIERREWQWLGGRDAEIQKRARYYLDKYIAPRSVVHGSASELRLIGWVATEPQVREVAVRFSNGHEAGGLCDKPRPDAIAGLPEFADELCGFEFSVNLDCLTPGTYEVEWAVPDFGLSEDLGKLDVLPRSVFKARSCFVPDSAFLGQDILIAVHGVLECSHPLQSVSVLWNGQKTSLGIEPIEVRRRSNGLYLYDIDVLGEIHFCEAAFQHRLELEFRGDHGMRYIWRRFKNVTVEETRPNTLSIRQVGELDPRSSLVPIYLRGGVLASNMEDRLILMCEGISVYEEKLAAMASPRGPIAWFEIQRKISQIPVGTWEFSLSLKQQGRSPEVFACWRDRVKPTEPIIHVEVLEARLPESNPSEYLLGVCGWVEHHELVDRLLLKLDDELVATLGINHFRTDIAAHFGETLVKKQGFQTDVFLNAAPGDHIVQLIAVQEAGTDTVWAGPLTLEDVSVDGFLLRSSDLDELKNRGACSYWSSITISGEVISELKDVVATLQVNGTAVDRQGVSGSFVLNHSPDASGRYSIRVTFQADGCTLYDSGDADVLFVKINMSHAIPTALERFINRFDIRECLNLEGSGVLARALVQLEREGLPEFRDMLRAIDFCLKGEKSEMALISPIHSGVTKPLKVLFASWEVPSSRHGGGVWMKNLLKQFHGRHEVTLIHAYGPGEEGWVDGVRPYVSKTISVPRTHQPALYRGDSRIPAAYYNDYTPALRAAIEAEVLVGDYDIVNHEYTKIFSHMSKASVAQVLVVHENIFNAQLNDLLQSPPPKSDSTIEFLDLLKRFYFLTGALPRACADIIGLTKQDTTILTDFQNRSRIYLNTIGVETGFPVPDEAPREFRRDHPTVVFLGNYRHRPNTDAAVFFVTEVMPGLRITYPDLEFLIIGSHPSDELKELDSEDGVSVTGFVDDYRPYLFAANAFAAPIFTGAGMRVKILEAMACGITVVGTGLSMNGIGAAEGEHYYRAESAAQFIEAVGRCLKHPENARVVGKKGRDLIVEKHSYERSARQRESIWSSAIDHWRKAKPAQQRKLTLVRGASDSSHRHRQ